MAQNKKLILFICLVLSALLWVLGCKAVPNIIDRMSTLDPNRFPVKSWKVTLDLTQRDEFFTQLQRFADKHSLELQSTFYDEDEKGFFILLAGDGFHISAISRTSNPREISIGFYNEASPSISQETFDELAVDLKDHIKKIPSIIIKEKLKRLRITMDENQSEEIFTKLFTQLQDFTDQHFLEFTTISYDSDMQIFIVEMYGNGFQITSEALLSPKREMNVDFYIHYDGNGTSTSTSQETVAELFDNLKSFFGKIPNVTITETK